MGVNLGKIVPRQEVSFQDLGGKILAVDSFNVIFQFLTTIRQIDGMPLMDSHGRITSHLSGLFYRFTNLMSKGMKFIFVFDGKVPKLKHAEIQSRENRKQEVEARYEEAKKKGEKEKMQKYAKRTSRLTDEMVAESKKLIEALGMPNVQAPSEGEAQAAFICKQQDAYAVASQDYDSLLFGSPKLVQNLTLARKRKLARGFSEIKPEIILLNDVKKELNLTQEQLIILGILIGTDYNPRGYVGVGPVKALELIKNQKNPDKIFSEAEKIAKERIEFDPFEVLETFKKIPVTEKYSVKFSEINEREVKHIMCKEHEFGEERIESALQKVKKARSEQKQQGLRKWL